MFWCMSVCVNILIDMDSRSHGILAAVQTRSIVSHRMVKSRATWLQGMAKHAGS